MGLTNLGFFPILIRAVKLTYRSPDHTGELKVLSGALIYPDDNLIHPLMSTQHGTVTKRTAVALVNPMNSSAGMSGLFTAFQGYITLVPDYAGFGDSHECILICIQNPWQTQLARLIRFIKSRGS